MNCRLLASFGLVAAALAPSPVEAQRTMARMVRRAFDYNAVELGLIGGPNRTAVTGAGPIDARFRGMLGGFVSVRLGEGFRLRPEMLASNKAVASQAILVTPCLPPGPCPTFRQTETTSLTWLEAPILLEYGFNHRGRAGLKVFAGPFVAIRVACSLGTATQGSPAREVRSCAQLVDASTQFNNGDAGFVVGGGLTAGPLGIGLRWSRSLVPLAPFQPDGTSRLVGAKQSTLSATVEISTKIW